MQPTNRPTYALAGFEPGPFAATLAALGEPESGPAADNLVSNEDSAGRAGDDLEARAPRAAVYLGVGPDQNFSYLARCRPVAAYIVDFRRGNALLHLLHRATFRASDDRAAYLTRLLGRKPGPMPADPTADDLVAAFSAAAFDRPGLERSVAQAAADLVSEGSIRPGEAEILATLARRLAGPGMRARFLALAMYPTLGDLIRARTRQGRPAYFLAEEARYRVVRDLQRADGVLPVVGDFAGPHAFRAIGDRLRRLGQTVGVFYASDVEFFLLRSGRFAAFAANLASLLWADNAVLIRTSTREINHPERVAGDSSTTILRPVAPFLERARAGAIRTQEDLFA